MISATFFCGERTRGKYRSNICQHVWNENGCNAICDFDARWEIHWLLCVARVEVCYSCWLITQSHHPMDLDLGTQYEGYAPDCNRFHLCSAFRSNNYYECPGMRPMGSVAEFPAEHVSRCAIRRSIERHWCAGSS